MDLREYMRARRERTAQKRYERQKAAAEVGTDAAAMHRLTEEAKRHARRGGGGGFDGGGD